MKKIVSIVGMAALVAGMAFADAGVSVGGWSRTEINVTSADGADPVVSTGPSWAGSGTTFARVGFNFNGHSDNAFASLNLDSNGNTFGVGDQAKVGIKFNDMVTVQFGKIQGDTLRGKIGDLYTSEVSSTGEDDIFARFYPSNGALVDLNLVPGLYIGLASEASSGKVTDGTHAQAGIGYTIEKVGLVRAQYIGGNTPTYQAAFQLTAIDKLNLDVGVKIPTADGAKLSAAAGASFGGVDKVDLQARFKYADKADGGMLAAAQATYSVDGPLSVGVGLSDEGLTTDTTTLKVAPFAKLGYSNGYARIGFIYSVSTTNSWTIPCTLEVWF